MVKKQPLNKIYNKITLIKEIQQNVATLNEQKNNPTKKLIGVNAWIPLRKIPKVLFEKQLLLQSNSK